MFKIHAENCESACKTRNDYEIMERAKNKELEDKYFPKYGNVCVRCQEKAISKAGYFLNMCDDCFKKEMSQLEKNLSNKKYQQAFAAVLARAIMGR